jgi:hypothetical protein
VSREMRGSSPSLAPGRVEISRSRLEDYSTQFVIIICNSKYFFTIPVP